MNINVITLDETKLNETATAILRELSAKAKDADIFAVKDFRKRWRKALLNAGINKENGSRDENYHVHDLRSWFAERLLKRNIHSKVIQNLFAHSDESITSIYLHANNTLMTEAVNTLDDTIQQNNTVN